MIRQNIGSLNALVRITCGLTCLSIATARMVRHPKHNGSVTLAVMGAMKVAEGIVRYCPVTDVVTRMISDEEQEQQPSGAEQ